MAHNHVVVTHETRITEDPKLTRVKIPNVCAHFGVTCITPFQMLRQLGAGFGLLPKQQYAIEESVEVEEETESDEDY